MKVTVWCAISSFAIVSPYFFDDEREKAVTVTGLNANMYTLCFSVVKVNKSNHSLLITFLK